MFRRIVRTNSKLISNSVRRSLTRSIPGISRVNALGIPSIPSNIRFYSISTEGEVIDNKIDQITDNEYNKLSNEYLEQLSESLEELNEEFEQVDCELSHGVLTLQLPPNGVYVINKQPPNKQIWLSSPISGPKRYDLIGGKWITLRDGTSLTELLQQEISTAINSDYKFENIDS
ncbi:YFH1 [[Candida] subhashii]|uniref:YFH1 n=1 Tax=[Candida] subhashii TaxID=561895 RepID=A0A8J5R3U7_9ASCO|nr:YFH1 [[Candida] subhashii]KAG7665065.1 YFH1 [[Candida] subhashii]